MQSFLLSAGACVCLAVSVTANCAYGTSAFPRLPQVPVSKFGYDGLKGPLNWFGLNETANSMCAKGSNQSPIVIDSTISVVAGSSISSFTVPDYPNGAKFENLGTNVEVVVNGSLVDGNDGITYKLSQFHFHTPAEHRVADVYYPMEMHWVLQSSTGAYAVIAFLVELCENLGCTDPVLESVFSAIGEITEPGNATLTSPLYFAELEQKFLGGQIWRYNGSLTTPPCSEGVDWLISQTLLTIDLLTYLKVKSVVKFNARYTQNTLGGVNLLENAASELCT